MSEMQTIRVDTIAAHEHRRDAVAQSIREHGHQTDSLVGSWFHEFDDLDDGEPIAQGLVVAEPQPGHYLCEFYSFTDGRVAYQRVVRLDKMTALNWRFFDTSDWMDDAYQQDALAR